MTKYAKCKPYEQGERFPFRGYFNDFSEVGGSIECSGRVYECWQPYEIVDEEFNVIILLEGVPVSVRDCQFDFLEVK